MKRISSLFLSLTLLLGLVGCGGNSDELAGAILDAAISAVEDYDSSSGSSSDQVLFLPEASGDSVSTALPEDGSYEETGFVPVQGEYYYDLESVVLYLDTYGELPDNYITKSEARSLGWEGGTPECFLEGAAIGGDTFGNREGILPDGDYTECDLNTNGADSRGAERLVFSDDGHYYHTEDHYETFTEVWVEDGEVIW
ncbi:MAG: hypothetical protein IJZ66_03605 [Oscillibacter sp.]|nr:hypothetical protein [Oscillibacter sp.]